MLPPFPDVEDVLAEALADVAAVDSVWPPDMAAVLADGVVLVRVQRLGGGATRLRDEPRVDVEVAASTRAAAWDTARTIAARLTSGPTRTDRGLIDRATVDMGPRPVDDTDEHARHVVTTFRLVTRRLAPSP